MACWLNEKTHLALNNSGPILYLGEVLLATGSLCTSSGSASGSCGGGFSGSLVFSASLSILSASLSIATSASASSSGSVSTASAGVLQRNKLEHKIQLVQTLLRDKINLGPIARPFG